MADTIPFPRLEAPGAASDPRTGAVGRELRDFLRLLAERTTDAATAAALNTLVARVDALESAQDDAEPLRIFATPDSLLQVYGDEATGFEIHWLGPDPTRISTPPVLLQEVVQDEPWPMPGPAGVKGDKGDPGPPLGMLADFEPGEPWPNLPPVNPYAEFTARSLTVGTKTIPAGYGLYVIGPYDISAGALVEVQTGAALEIG